MSAVPIGKLQRSQSEPPNFEPEFFTEIKKHLSRGKVSEANKILDTEAAKNLGKSYTSWDQTEQYLNEARRLIANAAVSQSKPPSPASRLEEAKGNSSEQPASTAAFVPMYKFPPNWTILKG